MSDDFDYKSVPPKILCTMQGKFITAEEVRAEALEEAAQWFENNTWHHARETAAKIRTFKGSEGDGMNIQILRPCAICGRPAKYEIGLIDVDTGESAGRKFFCDDHTFERAKHEFR